MIALAASIMAAVVASASDTGVTSLLFKESGSFWRTATSHTLTVPVDFKDGATSASLTVRGSRYRRVYEGIVTNEFTFSLPPADNMAHEDVYELSLVFDNGSEMKARVGLPYGLMAGTEGATRCLVDVTQPKWRKTYGYGLLPVPFGVTALSVDGSPVADGTDGYTGAQGWLALGRVNTGSSVAVSLTADEQTTSRTLVGAIYEIFQINFR